MKQFKFYIPVLFAALLAGCSSDDKLVDEVEANTQRGAVLRTISFISRTFDFNDPSKEWGIVAEEQDVEDGDLLQSVDVYVALVTASTGAVSSEVLLKTIPASDFSLGPNGLPRADIKATLTEVTSALGLSSGDFTSSDSFNIRMSINLTDGRTITNTDLSGTVSGGSFFSSPLAYSAQFFCVLDDASFFDGTYVVESDAWADYNPGETVPVEFVGDFTFRLLSTNNPFIGNPNSSWMEFTIDPTNGNVTVVSNECFDYGPGFCLDVTGSGTVGTCTGSISVVLDFGDFTNNPMTLVKQ